MNDEALFGLFGLFWLVIAVAGFGTILRKEICVGLGSRTGSDSSSDFSIKLTRKRAVCLGFAMMLGGIIYIAAYAQFSALGQINPTDESRLTQIFGIALVLNAFCGFVCTVWESIVSSNDRYNGSSSV